MPTADRFKRISLHGSEQFAFYEGLHGVDSFVAADDYGYIAAEGRSYAKDHRDQFEPRAFPGEAASGYISIINLKTSEEIQRIELEHAIINNGLAICEGRLYASCEDGFLRCYD